MRLTSYMQVQFVGEEAMDLGGPFREFWQLFMKEALRQLCIGGPGVSLFDKNVPALQVLYLCVHACVLGDMGKTKGW